MTKCKDCIYGKPVYKAEDLIDCAYKGARQADDGLLRKGGEVGWKWYAHIKRKPQ